MENNKYLLSICMPTYNRSQKAYNQLNFLLNETINMNDVEIIVANNASSDDTEERLLSLNNNNSFSYVKNQENIGLIGNINLLVKCASGKYIWIIGDDDIFPLGIVKKVHSILIKNTNISGVYINTNRSEKKLMIDRKLSAKKACAKLLPIIKGGYLFISANIIDADAMKKTYRLVDEKIEESLSVPMLCQFVAALKNKSKFEIIRQQTIKNDPINISWKNQQYKVAVRYNTSIYLYLDRFGYSKREANILAKKYYISESKRIFLEMIKHFKIDPSVVTDDFLWYLKKFPFTTFILLLTLPVRSIIYLATKKLRAHHE